MFNTAQTNTCTNLLHEESNSSLKLNLQLNNIVSAEEPAVITSNFAALLYTASISPPFCFATVRSGSTLLCRAGYMPGFSHAFLVNYM